MVTNDNCKVLCHIWEHLTQHMPGLDATYKTDLSWCPRCGAVLRQDYDNKQERLPHMLRILGKSEWITINPNDLEPMKLCMSEVIDLNKRSQLYTKAFLAGEKP